MSDLHDHVGTRCTVSLQYTDLLGKQFAYAGRGPHVYDCWGLCCEIYSRLGRVLPDYNSASESEQIDAMIHNAKPHFVEIPHPIAYCMALFMIRPPYVSHIGIVLKDCQTFIHIMQKTSVCVERLEDWKKRIRGFYVAR